MLEIKELLDLTKTIAAPLFEGRTYPWEVLPDIKDFIIELGNTLPEDEFEQRSEMYGSQRMQRFFRRHTSATPASSITAPRCATAHS